MTTNAPLITGLGASRGTASGRVRIIADLDQFSLFRPGDVLVCRTTSPAWTPLLLRAAAVITEVGSRLAHAAIVAREAGIPAVVGAAGAMTLLHDDQEVRVDGDTGQVHLVPTKITKAGGRGATMTHRSGPDLLTLHAVRLLGYATTPVVAARFDLPGEEAEEHLLDAQALGRVSYTTFGEDGGWSLTEAGRSWNERQLSAELDHANARQAVGQTHEEFRPHNVAVTELCTAWQLTELEIGEATADLESITAGLTSAAAALAGFETTLTTRLQRFAGYHRRFRTALDQIGTDPAWVNGTDRDSCHRVWFEFHEDLIATLGVSR